MIELNVSNIQHFSTGDGPGIRTTVFLKGCNLRCPWCHNPETISLLPQTLDFRAAGRKHTYGVRMSVEQVVSEVMEDVDFYLESGGGVTFSGGEPLLQAAGVAVLAKELRSRGISVVIDTAGCVPWEQLEKVLDVTDLFYFDYKTPDPETYAHTIGGNAALIYENLCRLIAHSAQVHVRIPLIPQINTSEQCCRDICIQLIEAGVKDVDLLPFHRMGSSKYEALGQTYAYAKTAPLTQNEIDEIASIYRQYFNVTIE